jgi:hypothetical protein
MTATMEYAAAGAGNVVTRSIAIPIVRMALAMGASCRRDSPGGAPTEARQDPFTIQ